jgi:hypothetical protein
MFLLEPNPGGRVTFRQIAALGWHLLLITLGTVALLLFLSPSALAEITEDEIGCSGSADIKAEDGGTTHIDAEDTKATVPREGTVRWRGATADAVHNHNGSIELDLGLDGVPIDDWGSENEGDEIEKRGTRELPEVLKWLPPGTYLVTGFHSGDEGSCDGEIEITLEGGSLDTVYKVGVPVLTLLALLGLVSAGRPRG